ncbi:MAG: hypothetical protein OEU36_25915 [Gammaproteobacteria bacterium]|nr:hypothetical protein [Gammaproteobacteria bacterium]
MSKVTQRPLDVERELLSSSLIRFNSKLLGLVLGITFGLAIFVATNWLVIKGGHINAAGEYVVGPNLRLLSQFFIGYRVSFLGSIIGLLYGFAFGTIVGSAIGWIYNRLVDLRK